MKWYLEDKRSKLKSTQLRTSYAQKLTLKDKTEFKKLTWFILFSQSTSFIDSSYSEKAGITLGAKLVY